MAAPAAKFRCRSSMRRPLGISHRRIGAARHLKAISIDPNGGQRLTSAKNEGFTGYFRLDAHNKLRNTRFALAGCHSLAREG
jgi:hypothetical protein